MEVSTALKRYLQRHIEPNLPAVPTTAASWRNVLVIPAYAESPSLLDTLSQTVSGPGRTLVILVLNRPESDGNLQCNNDLRSAIELKKKSGGDSPELLKLNMQCDLFVYDMEKLRGPSPSSEGVGLARKVGCDIALSWWHRGYIKSDWICSSDADAKLPADYFEKLDLAPIESAAATLPFWHAPGADSEVDRATRLYELRLHHYVLGLEYAKSKYAYHTLGSALAIKGERYAQVRGFPKRAGGEDFYLLNKIAKTGSIARMNGQCIELESRVSARVPFGTGPAVEKIIAEEQQTEQTLFYHPQCFHALRAVLAIIPLMAAKPDQAFSVLLQQHSLDKGLAQASYKALVKLGLETILDHCIRQSKTEQQFSSQFNQWFDGFRSLKFIHALRELGWQDQTLETLTTLSPALWPTQPEQILDVEQLSLAIQNHWGWLTDRTERT